MAISILISLVVFSAIVIVHELGHFLAARAVGIAVEEFAVGFGPKLFSIGKGTKFSLRLIPMGGFVRMLGEEDESGQDNPASYRNKSPWRRMATIAAGPLMNFLFALLIFIIIYGSVGVTSQNVAIIGQVMDDSPAQQAGLLAGDEILSIDAQPTVQWTDIQDHVRASGGNALTFKIKRNDAVLEITVTPRQGVEYPEVGIVPPTVRLSVGASIIHGIKETGRMTAAVFASLVGIITRKIPLADLTGPIGIVHYVGQAAQGGLLNVLSLAALISVNLGLFNLLPIPALDGSKIVLLGLELVRRRPLDPQKEGVIHLVGFALLIVLMVAIMYKDILRFIL